MKPTAHYLRKTLFVLLLLTAALQTESAEPYLSPGALCSSPDGTMLFVGCGSGRRVAFLDTRSEQVAAAIEMPHPVTGLAVTKDGKLLYVTCAAPESVVCVVDVPARKIVKRIAAGHTASSPVLSPDGSKLYVCNRFDDDISLISLADGKQARVPVQREPVSADITPDGKWLLVANLLHKGKAEGEKVASRISLVDTGAGKVAKDFVLPDGCGVLNEIRVSPDGKFAVATHLLSRFRLPATQLDRGWMNTNAKTLIDLERMEIVNTVLLDEVDRGAANPWGIAWKANSATVVIAHSGTHEISVIDLPGLLAKLAKLPATMDETKPPPYISASRVRSDVPNDLAFLVDLRRRIRLPAGDLGPRGVAVIGDKVYTANYFSENLTVFDLAAPLVRGKSIPLGQRREMDIVRKGEFYFHDAGICFQGWQSCATCHPGDGRVEGVNWDLLNDGIGNPKNTKSMLLTHQTPPAMSMGVRESGETAVRAGIRHILFTVQPEEVPLAMDAYLKSLKPVPSPLLEKGKLSAAAKRGQKLFKDREVGCATCHPAGLFTDLQSYDVGTIGEYDKPGQEFDTPTLVESWRTAPYLHDGSAATMTEVLTTSNAKDKHGKTSHLTPQQIEDLAAYVLSL